MANYFDMSKIKTFKMCDLHNRTVKIQSFKNEDKSHSLLIAFDVDSHECFILEVAPLPQCANP